MMKHYDNSFNRDEWGCTGLNVIISQNYIHNMMLNITGGGSRVLTGGNH